MKILVISAAYPTMHAGEATNTYHLCRHLADRKLDETLLQPVLTEEDHWLSQWDWMQEIRQLRGSQ